MDWSHPNAVFLGNVKNSEFYGQQDIIFRDFHIDLQKV